MWEHTSVSRPSNDPEALVAALDERANDGWELVAITPTGDAQLTAFLRRDRGQLATVAALPGGESSTTEETSTGSPWSATAGSPSSTYEPSSSPTSPWSGSSGGSGGSGGGGATTQATPPVEEPAGWASAPSATTPTPVVETPAPQPVAQPQTPANWYPDPSGRFELRYWNGTAWTEHVSRGGVQYTDPPTA